MSRLDSAIVAYTEGRLDETGFERLVDRLIEERPGTEDLIKSRLDDYYRQGRLPHELHTRLSQRLLPQDGPATGAEKTRVQYATDRATGPRSRPRETSWPTGTGGSQWGDPTTWSTQPGEALDVGSVLKRRFILEKKLGEGGMGQVYRARDLRKEEAQDRNPHVAVKVLGEDFKKHPESLKALQRESRKAQSLAHPNIVNVFDFDRDGEHVYMTMEYLTGQTLDALIRGTNNRGLPLTEAIPIIRSLCAALAHAHDKRIVHCDFKPGNVFICDDKSVKVLDFGIARAVPGATHGTDHTKFDPKDLGAMTPPYASCEMLEQQEAVPRDDVYALGCVTYEILSGRHPFGKRPALAARNMEMQPRRISGLDKDQWRTLKSALAFSRQERPASVKEFLAGLEGKTDRGRAATSWIWAGAAGLATAAVLGIFMVLQPDLPDVDQELRAALLGGSVDSVEPLDDIRETRRDMLLLQGEDYLSWAREAIAEGSIAEAMSFLTEGADNAENAFRIVLQNYDPASEVAADGILRIPGIYEEAAKIAVDRNEDLTGLELVCRGLQVHPRHVGLGELRAEILSRIEDNGYVDCSPFTGPAN